jgi:hypothetical protein
MAGFCRCVPQLLSQSGYRHQHKPVEATKGPSAPLRESRWRRHRPATRPGDVLFRHAGARARTPLHTDMIAVEEAFLPETPGLR